jgi:hypothetical protein
MTPHLDLLPARLTGSALVSPGRTAPRPMRETRRTLSVLGQRSIVAEAAVRARAHLIGQATQTSLRTSAAIHAEATALAHATPAAAQALATIASASTAGLTRIVLDASE